MNEQLTNVIAHHNEWADTYDDDIARMEIYNRVTLDNIRRFVPDESGASILDAGGGTGIWSIELAKMGYRVTLIDISERMLEKAKERASSLGLKHLVEIRNSNILDMPEFEDSSFAMIICQGDPLSYCGNHRQAMKEMVRVLSPKGSLIASVDNRTSALAWLKEADIDAIERFLSTGDVLIPPYRPEDQRYVSHCFTPTELCKLFEDNGLTVERIIGKPVLRGLSIGKSDSPVLQERLYQLELKYGDHPDFIPLAGHLEIVGRKI
ncbi:MAG: class I SAM-dependent methyltransferase [Armatimonadota bacterium]